MTAMTSARPDLLAPASRTRIMGILNLTPDSFYDGGQWVDLTTAIEHARAMVADGADILDVGGESSRPGAEPVSIDEECRRVVPVIEALAPFGTPVSVDTYHAQTAQRSLEAGAAMINDITALRGDPEMAGVVAAAGCSVVLMHMQGEPRTMQSAPAYEDVVDDIKAFFEARMAYAIREGIREEAIWLDPGFGFGKTVAHNLTLLRRLDEFLPLGRPVLMGTSNKSTIGAVLNLPVQERREGTAATVAIAILRGAACVRVHDVKAMARVARMTDAVLGRMCNE